MKKRWSIAVLIVSTGLAAIGGLIATDAWCKRLAREEATRYSLSLCAVNTLKHAYASRGLFTVVRYLGVSDAYSEQFVLMLGKINEHAEFHLRKIPKRDSLAEIEKDMWNNIGGIENARSREHLKQGTTSIELGQMVQDGQLKVLCDTHGKLSDKRETDLDEALQWFAGNQTNIKETITAYLEKPKS